MKTIRNRIAVVLREGSLRSTASRPRVRRHPHCETLEGRQLLSTAASNLASGMPPWGGPGPFLGASGGAPTAVQIAQFDGKGGLVDVKGRGPADFARLGKSGSFAPKALSAALKADLTTLQNDESQLQSEVPSSVTAAITADQAVISKALSSLPRPTHNVKAMMPLSSSSTNSPPSMTALLEKAGISATEATQISADFQTYQTDLQTIDPTLQSKITADKAAIAKDGGPTLPSGAIGMGFPGQPMSPPTST